MNQDARLDCGNGVRLERGVRCRMPDGVELVSDHYYPPQDGSNPTLLMRQPYGRDIASTVTYAHPAWFARHGYNVVIQDVRGKERLSQGEFYPFRHEGRDGAATIAWLCARPESNGRIGMYGFSYQGMTQLLAAAEQPEGLGCIAPAMTAHDLYHGWFYNNGALRLGSTLGWGLQMLKADARRLQLREASARLEQAWANLSAQTSALPLRDHPALHGEGLPAYALDWFDHAESGEYWQAIDVSKSLDRIRVPALHVSGWYDTYLKGSIDGFLALTRCAGSAEARENQYLVAGPWIHIPWGDRVGAADFGSEALLDMDAVLLRWCNHWLKDSNEFAGEPRVRHFVLGENRWRHADTFPVKAEHVFYLTSGGRANSRKGNGLLSASKPASGERADIFVYDPEVPVPAPGGLTAAAGPFDQGTLELGNNVLVYSSVPLVVPLRVFGAPRVSLYASSSAAHTDFTAKLVRVRRNGAAEFICIGTARSCWLFAESEYSAGYDSKMGSSISSRLRVYSGSGGGGDRLRLEVASSAFPLFDHNPGGGITPCRATSRDWQRSTQIVYHTPKFPSALYLPVIEGQG